MSHEPAQPIRDLRPTVKPAQLAKRWHVSVSKVLAWIESGELPAINLGTKQRQYRINERDIEEFEATHSAATTPKARQRASLRRRLSERRKHYRVVV